MKIYIKHMVSMRCKIAVKEILMRLELHVVSVNLGEIEIMEMLTPEQCVPINLELQKIGLELMEDRSYILVEKIKNTVIEMVHYTDDPPGIKFSVFLAEKLHYNYNYLSNLFSLLVGTTIERYVIAQKIARVKELLVHQELTLTEISFRLQYSSVSHLSSQFKKVTGITTGDFKKLKPRKITALEAVGMYNM